MYMLCGCTIDMHTSNCHQWAGISFCHAIPCSISKNIPGWANQI